MDNRRPGSTQPMSMFSVETTVTGNSQKKRKSGGLLSSLKFWKKKDKKNTRSLPPISRPTEFQHVSGTSPNRLVGATVEERYQKAVSLPQDITRHSALGSHAPFEGVLLEKQVESDVEPVLPRKILQRRATLPKMPSEKHESLLGHRSQTTADDGHVVDPADIGFAVTSGANFLKRRSRSADALYAAGLQQPQSSPPMMPYGHERRRSEDIRYWRASVCPLPMEENHEIIATENHLGEARAVPEAVIEGHPRGPQHEQETATAKETPVGEQESNDNNHNHHHHGTFDFGDFASTIYKQENIPLEDRMMTAEVKLMDLEYALSKLQSSTSDTITPMPDSPPQSHDNTATGSESIATSSQSHRSQPISEAATNPSVSTQPTTTSLAAPTDDNTSSSPSKFQPAAPPPSLTPSQIGSLLALIRREQAARHRLEDQIVQLQRDVKALRQQVLPSLTGTPFSPNQVHGHRGWSRNEQHHNQHHRRQQPAGQGLGRGQGLGVGVGVFDDTDTDTDDDEVYQTPTGVEPPRVRGHGHGQGHGVKGRREFEGGLMVGMGYEEGVAF